MIGNAVLSRMLFNARAAKMLAKLMELKPGAAAERALLELMKAYGNNILPVEAGAARLATSRAAEPVAPPSQ